MTRQRPPGSWTWAWLFPVTYTVHVLEEGFAGERFYRWIGRLSGRELTALQFWTINGVFWIVMLAAVAVVIRTGARRWVVPGLGALVLVNGLGHLAGTIATWSYFPGVVSGVLLWIPLGAIALRRSRHELADEEWRGGVTAGVVLMIGIAILALSISRPR